jgi:MoaA/NifB/PqqE/SkfB family radical SAM enzyme
VTTLATDTSDAAVQETTSVTTESEDLGAPLYVAWQITNECNLACLHCIEESGPGKAFADELDETQIFAVLEELMKHEVPYLSFSGGEPMLHPQFFRMVEYVCERGAQLKIETNGHYLSVDNCRRMKALGVKAVQVSLDGASAATFNRMRGARQFRYRDRWTAQPPRCGRRRRNQLLAGALQRP